jgi:hypothetical protein
MTTIDADYFIDKKIDSDEPPYIPINNCRKAESVPYNNFIGLKNNGNTCFFNSALQLLNSMELFRNYFLKLEIDDCNVFTLALKTVFTLMNFNDNNPIDLDKININHNGIINKSLLDILINEFKKSDVEQEQHDCSEYLIYLFDKLETLLDAPTYNLHIKNRLSRLYEFNLIEMANCIDDSGKNEILLRVGQVSNTYYQQLLLQIKEDNTSLQDLINDYFKITDNNDKSPIDKCSILFGKSKDSKYSFLNKKQYIPILNDCNKYIIISLGRIGNLINEQSTERDKDNTSIEPNTLLHIRNRLYKLNSLSIHINEPPHYVSISYDENDEPFILDDNTKEKSSDYLTQEYINENGVVFIYRYLKDTYENKITYLPGINIHDTDSFINLGLLKDDIEIKGNINSCDFPTSLEFLLKDKENKAKKLLYKCKKKHNEKYMLTSNYYIKYKKYKNKYLKLKKQLSKYQ